MDISTYTYLSNEIPEDIIESIEKDYVYLSAILDIAPYVGECTAWEDYSFELSDYPPLRRLPVEVIEEVGKEVSDKYRRSIRENIEETAKDIFTIRLNIGRQLEYIYKLSNEEESCNAFFIASYLDKKYYGSTFVFWSEDSDNSILVQAKSKCLYYSFLSIFSMDKEIPSLNTILEAPIEAVARSLQANKVYTMILHDEGKALERYGYKKTKETHYTCKVTSCEKYYTYVKTLE